MQTITEIELKKLTIAQKRKRTHQKVCPLKLIHAVSAKEELMQRRIVLIILQCPATLTGENFHATIAIGNRNSHLVKFRLQELGRIEDQLSNFLLAQVCLNHRHNLVHHVLKILILMTLTTMTAETLKIL